MRADRAGTKLPICAMSTIRPIWRRIVVLPAMFGPVRRIIRAASRSSRTSFGMKLSRGIMRSTHRMPARDDLEVEAVVHLGPHVALALGDLGERGQHIELATGRALVRLEPRDLRRPRARERVEELALARSRCAPRR